MSEIIAIRDMSAGNDSVGEMWQETKIFNELATLKEVMDWGCDISEFVMDDSPSKKRITLTRPHK